MLNKSSGKIGKRELYAIVIFLLVMKGLDTTPTMFFKSGENAAWVVMIIAALVIFPQYLVVLWLLKCFKDKGLIEIIYSLTGKYIGFIIGMILFSIAFAATATNSRSYVGILNDMFFPKTPKIFLYIVLMAAAYMVASRGFQVVGQTAWFFDIPTKLVFLIFIITALKSTTIDYLFPIAGSGIPELIKSGVTNSSIFGDILFLGIAFPLVRSYKDFKYSTLLGYGIILVELIILMLLYITTFDYPAVTLINYPFIQITRVIKLGRFFQSTESFFLAFWIMGAVLHFSIYLFLTAAAFGHTLKMKDFNGLLLPMACIIVLVGMVPENVIVSAFIWRKAALGYDWVFFIFLTILLSVLALVRKKKQNT